LSYSRIIAGFLVLAATQIHAETRPAITMEAALGRKAPDVSDVGWFDGSSALIGSWKEPGAATSSLEVWDLETRDRRSVGNGRSPSVSPNGQWLVYLDGVRWILMSLSAGTTVPLGEEAPFDPIVYTPPAWSRDSRYVAIMGTLRPPPAPLDVEPEDHDGVRVLDVGRVADGPATAGDDRPGLMIIDVREPGRTYSVPIEETHAYYVEWGGGHELYLVAMQGFWNGTAPYTALKRVTVPELAISEVYRMPDAFMQSAVPKVSPDGRLVALALDVDNRRWDDFVSLAVVDARSGELIRITREHYVVPRSYAWSADGESLYFVGRFGGLDQVFRAGLDGDPERITVGERRHYGLQISPDGEWLSYQTEDGYGRKDIRVRSLASGEERVIAVLSDPAAEFSLGEFRHVRWRSTDGLDIYGFLFLPPDFDPAARYPLYVDVHGGGPGARLYLMGPLSVALAATPLEWHAWAALGYVVFVPDFRSSGEYGPQVAAARYAARDWDWGGIVKDAEDIESGTRWMLRQDYIDRARVAVFGHSAGGARVNYLLTRSKLYGAGIIHDAIPAGALPMTLVFMSGRKTGVGFDESYLSGGLRIKEDLAVFTDGFLFDGYKSVTPTLIMVGDPDKGAIDTLSSEVLFSMLRQYKIPARMLRYVDEGHVAVSIASARHRYREIKRWLETYIPPPK
jgi:dipeptidyl aminopeptidase/acylaminoacyl peptidase